MIKFVVEIKNRSFLLFLSWLSLFLVFYYYKLICVLLIVFLNSEFLNQTIHYFIFTSVSEMFIIYINLCIFLTQSIFMYIVLYHLICYVAGGLFKKEYLMLKRFFFLSWLLAIQSLLFFQCILMPTILNFFLSFHITSEISLFFEAKVSEFLTFYQLSFINCFSSFQFCGFLILLTTYFDLTNFFLKKTRRFLYFVLLIFSTLLTPPDLYSQLISFSFFVLCFELFVFKKFLKKMAFN